MTFLGFDVIAADSFSATEDNDELAVTPVTASTDDGLVCGDHIASSESPMGVDPSVTGMVTASDDTPRHYWHRTDDDILYRPSRRPRSARRAWRARMASRS